MRIGVSIFLLFLCLSCSRKSPAMQPIVAEDTLEAQDVIEPDSPRKMRYRNIFQKDLIVIGTNNSNLDSFALSMDNYMDLATGLQFVAAFTSPKSFLESEAILKKTSEVGYGDTFHINGFRFLAAFDSSQLIRIDVALESEWTVDSDEMQDMFLFDIMEEMSNIKIEPRVQAEYQKANH
jgi:hypothetical protein